MSNAAGIVAGAVGGAVAGDAYQKAKDKAAAMAGQDTPQHGPIELEMLVGMVSRIERAIHEARASACPPKFEPVIIPANEFIQVYTLDREGYKHVSILTTTAFTIDARIAQLSGVVKFALSTGWNALDLPSGTVLWNDAGVSITAMLYKGDDSLDIAGV